jgi:hypothetical protein
MQNHLVGLLACHQSHGQSLLGQWYQVSGIIPLAVYIFLYCSYLEETLMTEIKRQFGIERLQYACVAQEFGDQNDTPHLHIQIILKEKANKKSWFLDDITGMYYTLNRDNI